MPLPPALFSTTTCCFHTSVSFSAIRRAKMSAAWPGGNGTTKRTGLLGHGACAKAGAASAAPATPAKRIACRRVGLLRIKTPPLLRVQTSTGTGKRRRLTLDTITAKIDNAVSLQRSLGFVDIRSASQRPVRHRLHGAGPVSIRYFEDFKVGDRFTSA